MLSWGPRRAGLLLPQPPAGVASTRSLLAAGPPGTPLFPSTSECIRGSCGLWGLDVAFGGPCLLSPCPLGEAVGGALWHGHTWARIAQLLRPPHGNMRAAPGPECRPVADAPTSRPLLGEKQIMFASLARGHRRHQLLLISRLHPLPTSLLRAPERPNLIRRISLTGLLF